jgi:hypothetical protein
VHVIFDESGELECGGDKVLFGVFVEVHSRIIRYVKNDTLMTENIEVYLGLRNPTVPPPGALGERFWTWVPWLP